MTNSSWVELVSPLAAADCDLLDRSGMVNFLPDLDAGQCEILEDPHQQFFFANYDIKCEVNTLRAQADAAKRNEHTMSCPARDTPSAEAVRVRPDFPAQLV